jgi:hypothetical protein
MSETAVSLVAVTFASLRRSHPHSPPLEVLDLMLRGCDPERFAFTADEVAPGTLVGEVIAEVFDEAMTPAEWRAWTGRGADLQLRDALLKVWYLYVVPRFTARYGCRVA